MTNIFETTPSKIITLKEAIKNEWLNNKPDYEQNQSNNLIIDYNEKCYYLMVKGELIKVIR